MAQQCSILMIEDEPGQRRKSLFFLKQAGYQVTAAASAKEAVHHMRYNHYDLVITDIDLPDIDGIAMLRSIRRYNPGTPVLVLAEEDFKEIIPEALREGAREALLKPFSAQAMLEKASLLLPGQNQP